MEPSGSSACGVNPFEISLTQDHQTLPSRSAQAARHTEGVSLHLHEAGAHRSSTHHASLPALLSSAFHELDSTGTGSLRKRKSEKSL